MSDLWDLVWGKPAIDANQFASALAREAARDCIDFRTRLLIRDGVTALEDYWGQERVHQWLQQTMARSRIRAIQAGTVGPVGFPYLRESLVERTDSETIRQLLRDLGTRIRHPVNLVIGGSGSLILQGFLSRVTQAIDVVDEVPAEIRNDHALLERLRQRYRLALTHFQSHFLPAGWEHRLHSIGSFGLMNVAVVDMHDLFLGKLFSPRDKDLDDLRLLLPAVDRDRLPRRLHESCQSFLADPALRAHAVRNWYVLTGDALPTTPEGGPP